LPQLIAARRIIAPRYQPASFPSPFQTNHPVNSIKLNKQFQIDTYNHPPYVSLFRDLAQFLIIPDAKTNLGPAELAQSARKRTGEKIKDAKDAVE